jgi:hypothetical protein
MDRGATPARWAARPWRARAVRVLVYAVPLGGSLLFVRLATALTGTPTSSLGVFLAWWFGMSAAATVVVSLIYAATRRLLPVGALLQLSLAFPREAPSRFRLALASGTVEELEARLREHPDRDPQEAARSCSGSWRPWTTTTASRAGIRSGCAPTRSSSGASSASAATSSTGSTGRRSSTTSGSSA